MWLKIKFYPVKKQKLLIFKARKHTYFFEIFFKKISMHLYFIPLGKYPKFKSVQLKIMLGRILLVCSRPQSLLQSYRLFHFQFH